MLKRNIAILLACSLLCCCSACGNPTETPDTGATDATASEITTEAASTAPETTPATETEAITESTEAPSETETAMLTESIETPLMATGTWLATGTDGNRYFFFEEDGVSGSFVSQSEGMGMGFNYETDGNTLTLHIGDMDDNSPVTVEIVNETHAVFTWENGYTEDLTYLSEAAAGGFTFYSDYELCEMALDYYERQNQYRPSRSVALDNGDGTVSIQLYDSFDDYNSTADRYTVDRYTAVGTDVMGNTIDLKS